MTTTDPITLVLVRHAKSDWGDPALDDHDRPLNERGERDAPVMARRLVATGFRPDALVSSTALRARMTADVFAAALRARVSLEPDLYGAAADELLAMAVSTSRRNVLLVAHDPGMSDLAAQLSDGDIGHMPTCAVATFRWRQDDWDVAASLDPDEWSLETAR